MEASEGSVSSPYSRARLAAACVSIAGNALCGGGIFIFPLISPTLALRLKFTQPQLTTIVLAGLVGQYPVAAFVGKIIDRYGPATCSLIAAPSSASFHRLTFYFFMAGLGTVSSYFSALFAASKLFPNHLGMASGITMSLFGLSPLLLSSIASIFFTKSNGDSLDITSFLNYFAIIAVLVYTVGGLNLRIASSPRPSDPNHSLPPPTVNERTRLLNKTNTSSARATNASAWDILWDVDFLLLGAFCLLTLGAVSRNGYINIGTILLSLPNTSNPIPTNPIADSASSQVRLISISNTVSRILVGPLADAISPATSFTSIGAVTPPKKHKISRIVFLTGPALLLAGSFLWMEFGVTSQETIWVLSVGTGVGYGAIFTVL
ncbi:major facilitator superfamily domain-containing protein [Infundibulicybe gibba]|nr:major facilitator superfamily domain-containing protein [Infundibulicybe gibba]